MPVAPRIDVLRRQLTSTSDLLVNVGRSVATLHELAYDRAAAAERIRVAGGQPDYALDRNGDPAARAAYVRLGEMVLHVTGYIGDHAHAALQIVTVADGASDGRRHPYAITAFEHAEALEAQARRIARGEFDPGRSMPQPTQPGASKKITRRIKALETELVAERRRRQRAEARIAHLEERLARREQAPA